MNCGDHIILLYNSDYLVYYTGCIIVQSGKRSSEKQFDVLQVSERSAEWLSSRWYLVDSIYLHWCPDHPQRSLEFFFHDLSSVHLRQRLHISSLTEKFSVKTADGPSSETNPPNPLEQSSAPQNWPPIKAGECFIIADVLSLVFNLVWFVRLVHI